MPDNQTDDEWFEISTVAGDPGALGTGVVLKEAGAQKDLIGDVTYDSLLGRAKSNNFFAFSWVPHAVASFERIARQQCGGRCSKTCKRPGCICDTSIGRCR